MNDSYCHDKMRAFNSRLALGIVAHAEGNFKEAQEWAFAAMLYVQTDAEQEKLSALIRKLL